MDLRERVLKQEAEEGNPGEEIPGSSKYGLPPHIYSANCWCDPEIEETRTNYIIIHREGIT